MPVDLSFWLLSFKPPLPALPLPLPDLLIPDCLSDLLLFPSALPDQLSLLLPFLHVPQHVIFLLSVLSRQLFCLHCQRMHLVLCGSAGQWFLRWRVSERVLLILFCVCTLRLWVFAVQRVQHLFRMFDGLPAPGSLPGELSQRIHRNYSKHIHNRIHYQQQHLPALHS